ncbi:transcriptional attenuator, LytR family [Clostridium cavendishii DSM 21758]|uniref:Transcriptional attenuator, LytR family n=1 Tax=Clostridium cavendishii DSM 21758 TaxID=1121302 RepID=A0A1M6Q7Q2_9CLOT|nr:LCP family protein [Clostridium cavendishii]SHK16221.1 transcriptional attenuator, LytR family [Clostridium cavendishii DSM 21758]
MSDYIKRSERNKEKKSSKGKNKKGKRKSKKFKVVIGILIALLIVLGVIGIIIYKFLGQANKVSIDDSRENLKISEEAERLAKEKKIKNILLIGSDEGTVDDHGRSDSMILISIDKENKKIKATSFMRDVLITIPGYGEKNLNNAYALGGSELLVKTFNYNFGLDIKDYAKVDFKAFVKVIDKLGGVDIDIRQDEISVTNDYIKAVNKFVNGSSPTIKKAGVQKLDGVQALGYSRNRYVGSDFARTNRQRIVLEAVLQKLSKAGSTEDIKYMNDILPEVTTTLDIKDLTEIGSFALFNKINTLESTNFPKSEETQNIVTNEYHMVVDKEKLKKEVQDYIYNDKK